MTATDQAGPEQTARERSDRRSTSPSTVLGVIFTSMEGRSLPGALVERQSERRQSMRMSEVDTQMADRDGGSRGSHRPKANAHALASSATERPPGAANAGPWRRLRTLGDAMIGTILRSIERIAALPPQWAERDRGRRHLREMSDYMLRDLGLSRADVERESSQWFWRK